MLRVDQGHDHAAGRRRDDALAAPAVRRESAVRRDGPRAPHGQGQRHGRRPGGVLQGARHAGSRRPRRSARCSWACGSSAPSATTIRPSAGARTTTSPWPASSRGVQPQDAARRRRGDRRRSGGDRPEAPAHRRSSIAGPGARRRGRSTFDDRPTIAACVLADWMTRRDNPFFAARDRQPAVGALLRPRPGRADRRPAGHQPGDERAAAGASWPKHLRESKYDLKAFTRTLLNSRVYQLASATTPSNADDEQNFSHAAPQGAAGRGAARRDQPGDRRRRRSSTAGRRGTGRSRSGTTSMPSYFFRIFGRPVRASVCECERSNEPSIAQALHLMNSPEIMAKIRAPRRARRPQLADSAKRRRTQIDRRAVPGGARPLCRREDERTLMLEAFAASRRPPRRRSKTCCGRC